MNEPKATPNRINRLNELKKQINGLLFGAVERKDNRPVTPTDASEAESAAKKTTQGLNQLRHLHIKLQDDPPEGFVWIENNCLKPASELTDYEMHREALLVPFVQAWMDEYLRIAHLKAWGHEIFDEILSLNQVNQTERLKTGKQPSMTLFPLDRTASAMRKIADRVRYEEDKMIQAQDIINGCLDRLADGKRNDTTKIVQALMAKNDKGEFSRSSIVKLRKIARDMEDKKWMEAMDIIQSAEIVDGVASYLLVSVRDDQGDYHPLPLDIASVRPVKRQEVGL